MSNIRKCIMNFNRIGQIHESIIPFRSLHCNPRIANKLFSNDKLLQITSSKTLPVHVQASVNISTSRILLSDIKTMSEAENSFNLHYKDILKAQSDESALIVDVREQSEIDETGKLPGSIHIPMGDVAYTFMNLSEKDFKEKFAKEKPSKDAKIIVSCRSGKRSAMVQEEIRKLGYRNAYNYVGGWLDWESNQKV